MGFNKGNLVRNSVVLFNYYKNLENSINFPILLHDPLC